MTIEAFPNLWVEEEIPEICAQECLLKLIEARHSAEFVGIPPEADYSTRQSEVAENYSISLLRCLKCGARSRVVHTNWLIKLVHQSDKPPTLLICPDAENFSLVEQK